MYFICILLVFYMYIYYDVTSKLHEGYTGNGKSVKGAEFDKNGQAN